jgi:hypothetical protein
MPWIITSPPNGSVIEDANGTLWTQLGGDGPGLLFPTVTLTLVGNGLWEITSNSPQTQQNRQVQLLGYGSTVPQQGYVMWEGVESDIPSILNLFGLPFGTLRLRYILPNGCEYLSDVLTTIPEIDPETEEPVCGTITVVQGEIIITNGFFVIPVTLSEQSGYPLGPIMGTIDGDPGSLLDNPIIGENLVGPFALGRTITLSITNVANPDCNIALEPVVTECPDIEPTTEVVESPGGDPPIPSWGVVVTPNNTSDYVMGEVEYETPLSGGPQNCTFVGGVWQCGPLNTEDDPGPMIITYNNVLTKLCPGELGPFTPAGEECPEADADYELVYIEGVLNLQVNINSNDPFNVGDIEWSINGTPQTPVEVNGIVGGYVLGPVDVGDEIILIYTNSEDPECNDVRPEFEVPSPCEYVYAVSVDILDTDDAPSMGAKTTSGFWSVVSGGLVLATISNADIYYLFPEVATYCVYPSDDQGNPTGAWTAFSIENATGLTGNTNVAEIDFSPLDGLALTDFVGGYSMSFINVEGWTTINLPALTGSNESLNINNLPTLTAITAPSGLLFKSIELILLNPIPAAAVDVLCNALDATATGKYSAIASFDGQAPTAASAANRAAYIANGNTLDVFP